MSETSIRELMVINKNEVDNIRPDNLHHVLQLFVNKTREINEKTGRSSGDYEPIPLEFDNGALEGEITIDQVEKILYPYEDLEYVEYINDVSQYSIGKKPSSFDLSIHESLYGTASAINKVNNSVHTITNDNSYIKLYFSSKSKITPKK